MLVRKKNNFDVYASDISRDFIFYFLGLSVILPFSALAGYLIRCRGSVVHRCIPALCVPGVFCALRLVVPRCDAGAARLQKHKVTFCRFGGQAHFITI